MTFYQWLYKQQKRQDPVGNLARDMSRDPNKPRVTYLGEGTRELLLDYITRQTTDTNARRAVERAIAEYQQQGQ